LQISKVSSNYVLAVLGGLLWWAAWPASPLTVIAFVAFVPLFFVDDNTASGKRFFWSVYVHMFVWNLLTTWWVYNASAAGAALAIVLNSLILCLPWLLMRRVRKTFGSGAGYMALIVFWISLEYIHHNWELSWPWLTLGNVFALHPGWIQWYEATGTTGGSLWILGSNVLVFLLIKSYRQHGVLKKLVPRIAALLALWAVPLLISNAIYRNREQTLIERASAVRSVVVVQPNVDPYNEKFTAGTQAQQIQALISLSEQQIDPSTALVIWPETAIPVSVDEDFIAANPHYEPVWQFLARHPQLSLLSGIDSYKIYGGEKKSATARYAKEDNLYYDRFNTAALLNSSDSVQFYHKAKLVPGVETLPSFLLWMGGLFEGFGGTSGTLGRDSHRTVFADKQHYFLAAPIICYESVYADYVTEYVRKGANLLTIITNDGWWGNTQGYRQHMAYARLRAIETRRWIARSANTGISCFIDPVGTIYQPQPWDTKAAIKMKLEPLQHQTFFVRHGDYLSRISNVASLVFLILVVIFRLRRRNFLKRQHVQATQL
jgi:apolipoprotein N-acyltransferase